MINKLRLLIVAPMGRIGKMRTEDALSNSNINVTGFIKGRKDEKQKIQSLYKNIPVYNNLNEAKSDDFEAVWISSSSESHVDYIKQAANLRKHIYCEKPITLTLRETEECYNLCEKQNVKLICAWQRRLDHMYLKAKQFADKNKPIQIRVACRDYPLNDPSLWLRMGSFWKDMVCHDINAALYFLNNKLPRSVYAHGNESMNELGVVDNGSAILEYENQRVILETSRYDPRGYLNTIDMYNLDQSATFEHYVKGSFIETYREAFKQEIEHFYQVVKKNVKPLNQSNGCINTQKIVEAIELSASQGRRVYLNQGQKLSLDLVGSGKQGTLMYKLIPDDFYEDVKRYDIPEGESWLKSNSKAVYICSPDSTHNDLTQKALNSNKHVFVEKPLSNYRELKKLANQKQLVLFLGFQRRVKQEFINAKKFITHLLQNKQPIKIQVISKDPVPADRTPKQVLENSVIHDIDMPCWLLDSQSGNEFEIKNVFYQGNNDFKIEMKHKKLGIDVSIFYGVLSPYFENTVIVNDKAFSVISHEKWFQKSYFQGYTSEFIEFSRLVNQVTNKKFDNNDVQRYEATFDIFNELNNKLV